MAAQEAIERLRADPLAEEGDDESEGMALAVQLIRLLSLLAIGEYVWLQFRGHLKFPHPALPRLVLRKSPSQTLAPLAELEQLLTPAANHATVAEGRLLVRHAAVRIQELGEWVKVKAGDDLPELAASRVRQLAHNSSSELTKSAQWTGPSGIFLEHHIGSVR